MRTFRSLCALSLLALCATLHAQKITLTQASVIAHTGGTGHELLTDEQATAGDPKAGTGGICTTQWSPGWASTPYTATIDLGATYSVTAVSLFSGNGGTQSIGVASGTTSTSFTPLYTETLSAWRVWYTKLLTATTARYIQVSVPAGNRVAEVVVYGTTSTSIPVTSVTVTPTSATLTPGATTQLTATVLPNNASNKNVNWSSSNTAIATVNASGLVTAVAQGSATVTATTVDQNKTATSAITVGTTTTNGKIALNETMISQENGDPGAFHLVDEQALSGDPRSTVAGQWGKPTQKWDVGWDGQLFYAVIDLGIEYTINTVCLFSTNGGARQVQTQYDNFGSWAPLTDQTINGYQIWNNVTGLNAVTRYVRVILPRSPNIGEIVLFGSAYTDTVAPSAITNLSTGLTKSNQITLHWTATGDNGNLGTAASYQIRRSTSAITTEAAFASATPIANPPAPVKAGSAQAFKVTGLNPGTTYHFAIKAIDESNNASPISNSISRATEPADTVAPAAITNLQATATQSNATVLKWGAVGDDGVTGVAERYELRRSTSPITSSNFSTATLVPQDLEPHIPGKVHAWAIEGLTPSTTYYFAVKAIDEVPNAGAISNVLAVTTLAQPVRKSITFDKFMGTHAFVDDPVNLMQATSFIREYHNWDWDEGDIWLDNGVLKGDTNYVPYPNNSMQFAPKFGGNWNFDTFYASVKAAQLTISPVIQGAVAWLQGEQRFPYHWKPIDTSRSVTTDPNSYKTKAHHSFQFAARYGRTYVPDNYLTLASNQSRDSGKDLVTYFEDYNEQNKDWEGAQAHFSAEEYAAMLSANYDGHGRTMVDPRKAGPKTFGVKVADPTMKMVMGGLAEGDLGEAPASEFITYLNAMKAWFTANRADGKFPADVINIHHYAFGPGGIYSGTHGKSPERDDFETKLKLVVDWRDANMNPETEIWLSEFGWDTNPGSPVAAKGDIPNVDIQEVQAQWLVRGYLACAAVGIDRAIQFMMRDVNELSDVHFQSSGLVGKKDDWTKKISWWYVATLKNVMTGTRFLGKVTTNNANVRAYKFKNVANSSGVYALWCPTEANITATYQLDVGSAATITQVVLTNNSTAGTETPLTKVNGKVTVNVSERPVFIKVDVIQ